VTFRPTNAVEIAGFRVWIDNSAIYNVGETIASGSVNANVGGGTEISGLTSDTYYAIEATDGPWYTAWSDHGLSSYGFEVYIRAAEGWQVAGGYEHGYGIYPPRFVLGTPAGNLIQVEQIDDKYARAIIKTDGAAFSFRVNENSYTGNFSNNDGTLGYVLKAATAGGQRTLSLNTVRAFNVCGQGIL
jgi:hypothetical protein